MFDRNKGNKILRTMQEAKTRKPSVFAVLEKYLLSLKGSQLGEFEILWKQLDEFFGLVYHEATSMRLPRHNKFVPVFCYFVKHVVKFQRERNSDTSASGLLFSIVDTSVLSVIMVIMLNNNVKTLARLARSRRTVQCGLQYRGVKSG